MTKSNKFLEFYLNSNIYIAGFLVECFIKEIKELIKTLD